MKQFEANKLAVIVAKAAFNECFEMGNAADYCEYHAAALEALNSGDQHQIDWLFRHLYGWFTEYLPEYREKEMPLTFQALTALLPIISDDLVWEYGLIKTNPATLLC